MPEPDLVDPTPEASASQPRRLRILVYGWDRKGLSLSPEPATGRSFELHAQPFDTACRFDEFDGLITPQGIFEDFEPIRHTYSSPRHRFSHTCYRDQLDRRTNELLLLRRKGGFVCFVLCQPFQDRDGNRPYHDTDLAKRFVQLPRVDLETRYPVIRPTASELERFISRYGAACSYFENTERAQDVRILAYYGSAVVGYLHFGRFFFIPARLPSVSEYEEYFRLLATALCSLARRFGAELPGWIAEFDLGAEQELETRRDELRNQIQGVENEIDTLQQYKRVLALADEPLAEAVTYTLKQGMGFKVKETQQFREDVQILDSSGVPIVFVEVKGTNRGVKREHVNQTDSHRERAGQPAEFPCVLIINTHIMTARSLAEKDRPVSAEQVQHAKRQKVLILRTLDLLRLLDMVLARQIPAEKVLEMLSKEVGWLRVSDGSFELV